MKTILSIIAGITGMYWTGCTLFDDPIVQIDPKLIDSTLIVLDSSYNHPVQKVHLLESFGAFGCVSCPEAEERLSYYLHAGKDSSKFNPRLIVVNYHVQFAGFPDPWKTPNNQRIYNLYGFPSLPQVKLNGSNTPYGVPESEVLPSKYDSLLVQVKNRDTMSYLEIVLPDSTLQYDTANFQIRFDFEVLNRDTTLRSALSFRVLVVKNKAVFAPYPGLQNVPWEVIVLENSDLDFENRTLTLPQLKGLRKKRFSIKVKVPDERGNYPGNILPVGGPEKLHQYALIIAAFDSNGILVNTGVFQYSPLDPSAL